MSDYLSVIQSLDREINNILAEHNDGGSTSSQTKENDVSSTEKNVTSKNFISSASGNIIKSPFVRTQTRLKSLTALSKDGEQQDTGSDIVARIMKIFKF